MLSKQTYEIMKEKYGNLGSWAIWAPAGSSPKSYTDDMSWINDPNLLEIINTGYVFVGRSWSRGDPSVEKRIPWSDFHSGSPHQNDYKLRYALKGTRYWGSYITDFYLLDVDLEYYDVDAYAHEHPEFVKKNLRRFEEEISYLGNDITLVAMGDSVFKVLKRWLSGKYKILKIMNYAQYISKEDYREVVLNVLDGSGKANSFEKRHEKKEIKPQLSAIQSKPHFIKPAKKKPTTYTQNDFKRLYPVGCRIRNKALGNGEVKMIGNGRVSILFDNGEEKSLLIDVCLKMNLLERI